MTGEHIDTVVELVRAAASGDAPRAHAEAELLELAASGKAGRAQVVGLLNRAGTTDAMRRLVLGVIDGIVETTDAALLARVSVRQRPTILLDVLSLLERTASADALFLCRKVLSRREAEVAQAAAAVADRLAGHVKALQLIEGRDAEAPPGDPERELAVAAAAAGPDVLVELARRPLVPAVNAKLAAGISRALDELGARSKVGSLNDYDARLRDELHEVVLLSGIPGDAGQQDRAIENLFRRKDLDDVREIGPHLPASVLSRYAARALTRPNRRSERADRAALALRMLDTGPTEVREDLRDTIVECLDEPDIELRVAAAHALAADAEVLPPGLRSRMLRAYGELPPEHQQRLAPRLAGLAAGGADELDLDSFLRWVHGASAGDLEDRLVALKTRWETSVVTPDQATRMLETLGLGAAKLPPERQEQWREEVVEGALSWLYRQGTQIVEPSRALLRWRPFAKLVLSDLDLAVSLLRAEQARGLVSEILRSASPGEALLGAVAAATVDAEVEHRVVLPVLTDAVGRDPGRATAAFEEASEGARRRLLAAAVLATRAAKRRIEELGQSTEDEAGAAVARHSEAVFAALEQAERASEGNESLQRQFDSIRRAVASVILPPDNEEAPEGVRRWREEARRRFPDLVRPAADGTEPLRLKTSGSLDPEGALRLLLELDQRVHSSRVVAAVERQHLKQDLAACIEGILVAGLLDDEDALLPIPSGRPALGQTLWSRWSALHSAEAGSRLVHELGRVSEPKHSQRALMRVDALVAHVSQEDAVEAAAALPPDALGAGWTLVRAALASRLKQVSALEAEARTRGLEVMERVADRLDPPLKAIEGLMVGYFRLRRLLTAAGWRPVEETLGRELAAGQLDPATHEVEGSAEADRFIVRSLGIKVRGGATRRAVVEAIEDSPADRDQEAET